MSAPSRCAAPIPDANDGMGGFCPRRTVLDNLLVNAAADAGAEVREGFTVVELLRADDVVVGIRGHAKGMKPVEERARFVLGADGVNEVLAAHEATRNERVRPMYEFITQLAALEPLPPEMQALFGALRGNQDATNAFLSAITGAIPLPDFMSNENLGRIMAAAKDVELQGKTTV
jgi:2-polyprenyl-6-methoxyphenol hydroxylase-like FAD-dependent oxidoreductase